VKRLPGSTVTQFGLPQQLSVGTRVTVMVTRRNGAARAMNAFVFERRPTTFVAYLDEQYGKGDFKESRAFQLADEGITWARGWNRDDQGALTAAYLLAKSAP